MRFNALLKEHSLEDKVELKGSFCMERCGEGINWQIDEKPFTSDTVEDAVSTFKQKIVNSEARQTGRD
jgi:NADH:ubiquinone oxidoreductase subunit E